MPRLPGSISATAALGALGLLCVALPLARGGVDWPVQAGAVLVAAMSLLLLAGWDRGATPLVVAGLAVATVATALQLLPVPPAVHRLLSPGAASLFETALRPLGLYPAARPLSLDPPATARELAKAAACLLAATASARLAASRRRSDRLLAIVALSGVAVAALGLAAAVAGMAPLLEPHLTFVNPNHLAGFLNLTSFIALGFALRAHGQARRLWILAFAVSGSGVFFSLSRGGIAAFFVGAAVFALLYVRRARLEAGEVVFLRYAVVPAAVSLAMAVTAYLALDRVVAEMRTVKGAASEAKLAMWPVALGMLSRFPWVGIGRGAFATAFAGYKVEPDPVTFTHVENEWIQAPLDLGVPLGLLLVGVVAWTWLRAARSRDLSRPEIGALAGAAALAAHNLVDFSLELLGVAIPFAVVLGLLAKTQPSLNPSAVAVRAGAVAALALAALGMGLFVRHRPEAWADAIARAPTADGVVALARSAATWSPADYLPQASAGARLVQEGRCAEGLPWLARAMELNPTAAEPHRFAARCFSAGGKHDLAKREYRLALLLGDGRALAEAARHYSALQDLLTIAPDAPSGLASLANLLASADRPFDAERVLRRAWEEYADLDALRGLAWASLAIGETAPALDLARLYQRRRPTDPSGYVAAATALMRLERGDEARQELELGLSRIPGSPQLVTPLAERLLAARRYGEARRLAESMAARTGHEVASKRAFVARLLWAQGRYAEAIQEARSARDASPGDPGPRLMLASLCADAGRYDEAIAAVEGAAALPTVAPGAYASRLAELRAARQARIDRRNREQYLEAPGSLPGKP